MNVSDLLEACKDANRLGYSVFSTNAAYTIFGHYTANNPKHTIDFFKLHSDAMDLVVSMQRSRSHG